MKWFKDLKISSKLLLCFAIVASIAGLVGWAGLSGVSIIAENSESMYGDQLIPIRDVSAANTSLQLARSELRDMILEKEVQARQKYVDKIAAEDRLIDSNFEDSSKRSLSKAEQDLLPKVKSAMEQYRRSREKVFELLLRGQDAAALNVMNGESRQYAGETVESFKRLVDMESKLAEEHHKESLAAASAARTRVLALLILGVVAALGIGMFLARLLGRPMAVMQAAAQKLATGDVDVTIEVESKDEIGALATAFRDMIAMIKDRASLAQRIAAGDVQTEVKSRSDQDVLGKAFLQVEDILRKLIAEVDDLTKAAEQGKLATRGNAQQFKGGYRQIVDGLNATLDAVIAPLNAASACFDKIGNGQIPQRITKDYSGDFALLKDSANNCITGLEGLQSVNTVLQLIAVNDYSKKIEGQYPGIFGEVGAATNQALLRLRHAVEVMGLIADGNFRHKLEELKRLGKRSENDTFIPAFVKMMEAMVALVDDANLLAAAAVQGNLTTRANATRHQGDYRKVVEGVNATLDAVIGPLQEVQQALAKLADGDFSIQIEKQYAGDFNHLKDAMNTMVAQVRSALVKIGKETGALASASEQLDRVSQQMSASAEETAAQANVVSAASEQVSTNIQTVATGADEMGASIKEIAKNTADATKIANNAVQLSRTTNETVRKLGASSAEIGQVIKVITSIAQQTNLLALNATIEAARAGEAGKGFAVVANEVKELAKQTAQATEDISQKIQAIQQDTGGAVTAIGEITEVIGQISDIQNTVATAIEEQSATTNEISRNLAEAAKGGADITLNITSVAQVAKTTTEAAGQTQMSAKSLENTAEQLRELVSQFRYEDSKPKAMAAHAGK